MNNIVLSKRVTLKNFSSILSFFLSFTSLTLKTWMKQYIFILLFLGSVINLASCFFAPGERIRRKIASKSVAISSNNNTLPEKYGPFFYDQPVDHFLENSTTFKHRYWANTEWYQPGGPVLSKCFVISFINLITF